MKHPSHFDLKLGVQGTDSGYRDKDPPSLNIQVQVPANSESSLVTISADKWQCLKAQSPKYAYMQ